MRRKKPVKLHWASSKPNFGDRLSPLIVARVSGRPVELASIRRCDLVAVGSLLQRLRKRFWRPVHIWGAGFIAEQAPCHGRYHVHAVRGPESAALLAAGAKTRMAEAPALGDPALLAGMLDESLMKRPRRQRLTVIPHYKDQNSEALARLKALNPDARILSVFDEPLSLLRAIAESQLVVSSAMHGLIAADALGVPNCRIVLSDGLRGGDFKFRDYYGAFGIRPPEVGVVELKRAVFDQHVEEYRRPGLEGLQAGLIRSFPEGV